MPSFEQICRDIKEIKIQGAEEIAKAGILALKYKRDKASVRKLLSLRPTEPALRNGIKLALNEGVDNALEYFRKAEERMIKNGAGLIENKWKIYTHCHSTSVNNIFKLAKKQGKSFTVYNTETRPLFQGRVTSQELSKNKIKNVHVVDSAMKIALQECDVVMIGADAINEREVINKVGSGLLAHTTKSLGKPLVVCSIGLKFDIRKDIPLEERNSKEVWANPPKGVKVLNPAFEAVEGKDIIWVISELGILGFNSFVGRVMQEYKWLWE